MSDRMESCVIVVHALRKSVFIPKGSICFPPGSWCLSIHSTPW